jgi:hypothetical protein
MNAGNERGDDGATRIAGMHDEELVRRLRERDAHAFGVILDDWSPGMLRLARTFAPARRPRRCCRTTGSR